MRSTGIVRRIDQIGRVVLPVGLRHTLEIKDNDGLEIFTDKDRIVLRKYKPTCLFCGTSDDMKEFKGKNVCKKCLSIIK
ncbi:MAG: AbrB family transcriptional regulator [Negativicutes bacterium]|nr:AbrB family transcriptional regulator [Negativicutes bacterium]